MIPFKYSLRSLSRRRWMTIAAASGIAVVAFLFVAVQMFSRGLNDALRSSAEKDVAIILSKGATTELSSLFPQRTASLVTSHDSVVKGADGSPMARMDVTTIVKLEGNAEVRLRGVAEKQIDFREVTVTEGRLPEPGKDEAMVGVDIAGQVPGLVVGGKLPMTKGRTLSIVGTFESGAPLLDSEVWTLNETLQGAFGLQGQVSSLRVRFTDRAAFDRLKSHVETEPQLSDLEVVWEPDYYRRQAGGLTGLISLVAMIVVAFSFIGAMLGATITMYSAVARRSREIGSLRALGFSKGSVLWAFIVECTLLSVIGGVVGTLAALAMQLVNLTFHNPMSHSVLVISFDIDPIAVALSLAASILLGIVGGLLPAIRASRLHPIDAIRAA